MKQAGCVISPQALLHIVHYEYSLKLLIVCLILYTTVSVVTVLYGD